MRYTKTIKYNRKSSSSFLSADLYGYFRLGKTQQPVFWLLHLLLTTNTFHKTTLKKHTKHVHNLTYITHSHNHSLQIFLRTLQSKTKAMASCVYYKPHVLHCFILASILAFSNIHADSEPYLTLDYYKKTCPTVLEIIRKEMECAVLSDPRNAALILRLHFHDCFVQVSLSLFFFFYYVLFGFGKFC